MIEQETIVAIAAIIVIAAVLTIVRFAYRRLTNKEHLDLMDNWTGVEEIDLKHNPKNFKRGIIGILIVIIGIVLWVVIESKFGVRLF